MRRAAQRLQLEQFVPFRLNRLAAGVSQHLSAIYRERFALEIPDWRVMATVGERGRCTAQHVAMSTRMHKTRVSRAIARLRRRGLIARRPSPGDGREKALQLTRVGRRLYAQLVPLALARERALLRSLSAAERRGLEAGIAALEQRLRLNSLT
ncbi:MAG: MarR family winged helix-turn-helix transcriptional regulator [Steroidobacteraceae bacterium]